MIDFSNVLNFLAVLGPVVEAAVVPTMLGLLVIGTALYLRVVLGDQRRARRAREIRRLYAEAVAQKPVRPAPVVIELRPLSGRVGHHLHRLAGRLERLHVLVEVGDRAALEWELDSVKRHLEGLRGLVDEADRASSSRAENPAHRSPGLRALAPRKAVR